MLISLIAFSQEAFSVDSSKKYQGKGGSGENEQEQRKRKRHIDEKDTEESRRKKKYQRITQLVHLDRAIVLIQNPMYKIPVDKKAGTHRTGLVNFSGNNCYQNALFQCLSRMDDFVWLLSCNVKQHSCKDDSLQNRLLTLMNAMRSGHYSAIDPMEFSERLAKRYFAEESKFTTTVNLSGCQSKDADNLVIPYFADAHAPQSITSFFIYLMEDLMSDCFDSDDKMKQLFVNRVGNALLCQKCQNISSIVESYELILIPDKNRNKGMILCGETCDVCDNRGQGKPVVAIDHARYSCLFVANIANPIKSLACSHLKMKSGFLYGKHAQGAHVIAIILEDFPWVVCDDECVEELSHEEMDTLRHRGFYKRNAMTFRLYVVFFENNKNKAKRC